jgi:GNAT superfamily N-acetyltransferase
MALWRVRATVDDRPGYLSVLTASLALRSVNILAVQVHTTEAGAVDDFLVDTPDTMSEADLLGAVARGRGRDAFVARAEAQGLADQPTRALALAGRLVHDPDALGEALAALLDAAEVRWRPDTGAVRPGFSAGRMSLVDPAGGTYDVSRAVPAFTPAEYARAQALVEVAGALLRQHAEHTTLLLPDGAELLVRPGTADDVDAVRRMHERCPAATRQHRHPAGGPAGSDSRLRRLLQPAGGVTLLAVHLDPNGDERVVAMANLLAEGDLGQVALLVQDDWRRRGIGTALVRRLVAYARRAGIEALIAHTVADDVAMLRTLRRVGVPGEPERDGALASVTLPVSGPPAAPGGTRADDPSPDGALVDGALVDGAGAEAGRADGAPTTYGP